MKYKMMATSVFGMESVLAREIKNLGFENVVTENGRVFFDSDERGIVKANLWLRCAERVFLVVGKFKATSFEELFDKVTLLPWERFIREETTFPVNAKSVKSKLFSLSDIQSISKKAIVNRLKKSYNVSWLEETGETVSILVSLLKDEVIVSLDTSGTGLHKRGYREKATQAPMKETLAAGLVQLSRWYDDIPMIDPMCGSGTILIEAGMIAKNIAPGLSRSFACEDWPFIPNDLFKEERRAAYAEIKQVCDSQLMGYDIDPEAIEIARENAEIAGVDDIVTFDVRPLKDFRSPFKKGYILCNPPYGERLSEQEQVKGLYREMGKIFEGYKYWSKYIITSYETFETAYGKKATKNRKLYNGRIKTYYYQYFGERLPKKPEKE